MTITPNGSQTNRLVVPVADAHARPAPLGHAGRSTSRRRSNTTQCNLAAFLVDYGAGVYVGRGGSDGVSNTTRAVKTCCGRLVPPLDNACYSRGHQARRRPSRTWRVSKGILDSSNRDSLFTVGPRHGRSEVRVHSSRPCRRTSPFPAGHQIGVDPARQLLDGLSSVNGDGVARHRRHQGQQGHPPDHGGPTAATASAGFVADTTAPRLSPARGRQRRTRRT